VGVDRSGKFKPFCLCQILGETINLRCLTIHRSCPAQSPHQVPWTGLPFPPEVLRCPHNVGIERHL